VVQARDLVGAERAHDARRLTENEGAAGNLRTGRHHRAGADQALGLKDGSVEDDGADADRHRRRSPRALITRRP
jgi:hypothetical protein